MLDCILLCGRLGKWIDPDILVKIKERPLIDLQLAFAERFSNIEKIILAVQNYNIDKVRQYLEKRYNQKPIPLSVEDVPLGTGGAVKKALGLVTLDFVAVCNYTSFAGAEFDDVERYGRSKNSNVICYNPTYEVDYGILTVGEDEIMEDFKQKPIRRENANCGWYLFKTEELRAILSKLPERFNLEKAVFERKLIEMRCYNVLERGKIWQPIDSRSDVERIEEMLERR